MPPEIATSVEPNGPVDIPKIKSLSLYGKTCRYVLIAAVFLGGSFGLFTAVPNVTHAAWGCQYWLSSLTQSGPAVGGAFVHAPSLAICQSANPPGLVSSTVCWSGICFNTSYTLTLAVE